MRNGVPATVVDLLHENFAGLLGVLDEAGEVSLRAVADENFRSLGLPGRAKKSTKGCAGTAATCRYVEYGTQER